MASKTGMQAFFLVLSFADNIHSLLCTGGRDVRRGGGQRSFFPSEMQSRGFLPASRALEVKHKNGRSERSKKNDILLVTTPPASVFVVGASAFNWKQVSAPPVLLQCPTHTYAHTCTCSGYSSRTGTSHFHPLKPGDSLLNRRPHAKPRSPLGLCPHLVVQTAGGQVGAPHCRCAGPRCRYVCNGVFIFECVELFATV